MKTASKDRSLTWINNQYDRGNISFSHKLQRPIGQWSPKMKSLLIHSLLVGFPVNPIYVVEENNVIYTLDGSQRTSTCISYIKNEFALSKDTPNITLSVKVDGEPTKKEFVIAGKKFKKLETEVQEALMSSGLEFCTLSDYTEDEVREMFRRQNSGKPLNGKLLRIVQESDRFSDLVYTLATHPFMGKIMTKSQRKNGTDRDVIIQTFMLIESGQDRNFVSFRNKDIDAYRVKKDKKSFTKLVDVINKFLADYDTNEKYKQYVTSGTSGSENVKGRFDYWKGLIKAI